MRVIRYACVLVCVLVCVMYIIYRRQQKLRERLEGEREKETENLVGRATKARMHCKVLMTSLLKSHFFGFCVESISSEEKKTAKLPKRSDLLFFAKSNARCAAARFVEKIAP